LGAKRGAGKTHKDIRKNPDSTKTGEQKNAQKRTADPHNGHHHRGADGNTTTQNSIRASVPR